MLEMKSRNQGQRLREREQKEVARVLSRIPDPDVHASDPNAGGVGLSSWMLNVVALIVGVIFAYLVSDQFIVGPVPPEPSPSPEPTPEPTPDPTPEEYRIHNAMYAVGVILIFFLAYLFAIKTWSIAQNTLAYAAGVSRSVAAAGRAPLTFGARLLRWIFIPQVITSLLFITFMVLAYLNWDTPFFSEQGFLFGDIFLMNTVLFLTYTLILISIWPTLGTMIIPVIVVILFLYNGLLSGILSDFGINSAFAVSAIAFTTGILGLFSIRRALPPSLVGYSSIGILAIASLIATQFGFNALAQQEKTGNPAVPGLVPTE